VTASWDAIRRVIDAFERSDWSEIDVRTGDVRVHLSAATASGHPATTPSAPADARPPSSDGAVTPVATRTPADDPAEPAAVPPGAEVVASPSPGIFWRSPEPGAPPFADVGDQVGPGTTLCIVEVMKLMNHIKAGMAGEVVAVFAQNGVEVRKGEPLFALAPAETTP
jgi:acetyl-CoA carboxylase biotin carboxyl carrier protein